MPKTSNGVDHYGMIYKITDLRNNKIYIGQTTQFNLKYYFCGSMIIRRLIKKYGNNFFKKEILGFCESKEELDISEKECILFFNSQDKRYGYNIREGGANGKLSEETKNKIRNSHLGKSNTEEHNKNIGKASKGRKHSDETKRVIGEKSKGRTFKLSDETKENIRQSRLCKKFGQMSDKGKNNIKPGIVTGKQIGRAHV